MKKSDGGILVGCWGSGASATFTLKCKTQWYLYPDAHCVLCVRCCAIAWDDCNFLSNCRLYFNTWVWLQDRSCFPGGADTPAGGWVDRHGAGAVVQRPGHRGRTDNYKAKKAKKRCLCISYSEVAFLTQSKYGSGVGGCVWGGVCYLCG